MESCSILEIYNNEPVHTEVKDWSALFETPVEALAETRPELIETPKKRGRPKKHVPQIEGKHVHKIEHDQPHAKKTVSTSVAQAMIRDFRRLSKHADLKDRIDTIVVKHNVSYRTAYEILQGEF